MKKHQAFTLLETMISLGIICSLLIISLYNLKGYQEHVEEQQSLVWFKDSFKNAFNYCYLNKRSGSLFLNQDNNKVTFNLDGKNGKRKIYQKKLPAFMSIVSASATGYWISSNGQGAPVTIIFKSALTKKKYIYKIQMGWGEINEIKT